jgi:hypothetical protein
LLPGGMNPVEKYAVRPLVSFRVFLGAKFCFQAESREQREAARRGFAAYGQWVQMVSRRSRAVIRQRAVARPLRMTVASACNATVGQMWRGTA